MPERIRSSDVIGCRSAQCTQSFGSCDLTLITLPRPDVPFGRSLQDAPGPRRTVATIRKFFLNAQTVPERTRSRDSRQDFHMLTRFPVSIQESNCPFDPLANRT